MHRIHNTLAVAALGIAGALPVSGFAQAADTHVHQHGNVGAPSEAASMSDGMVKKVDQDTGKATIQHGEIKHLDMPGMTMVFTVKDKGLLTGLKPGDKIKFMVVSEGGRLLITDIQPAR